MAAAVFLIALMTYFGAVGLRWYFYSLHLHGQGDTYGVAVPYSFPENQNPKSNTQKQSSSQQAAMNKPHSSPSAYQRTNAVVGFGTVRVESYPWSEVFLDGQKIGDSPFPQPVSVPAGDHTMKLVFRSAPAMEFTVNIPKEGVTRVQFNANTRSLQVQ